MYFEIEASGSQRSRIDVRLGNLQRVGESLSTQQREKTATIVTDEHVFPLYGEAVANSLAAVFPQVHTIVLPAGEAMKSPSSLAELWTQFSAAKMNRDSVVVALGGGVIGDLAGFAAATYARGIPWIVLPTTLMAQVDSAIGGKVGINLSSAKNLAGAFWLPDWVIIDPVVLGTLPEREFVSGLAEVVKYAVIQGEEAFERLADRSGAILRRDHETIVEVIAACCDLKSKIVQADFREQSGARAVLNYGHTYAHAIERVTGYGQFTHGEAVAIGMTCAAQLACQRGLVDQAFCDRQTALLKRLGLPTRVPLAHRVELADALLLDKKNRGGHLRFVLPRGLGDVSLYEGIGQEEAIAVFAESAFG